MTARERSVISTIVLDWVWVSCLFSISCRGPRGQATQQIGQRMFVMLCHCIYYCLSLWYPRCHDVCTVCHRKHIQTAWAKKRGHRLMTIILSILTDLRIFFTERFLVKLAVKWMLRIPLHLAFVATLPCETIMSAKQAINDKLQGSAATYWKCDGVFNNRIKKKLLLSLWVRKFFKSVNIWQRYKQEHEYLVHLANTMLKDGENARNNHVLACNFAKYSTI